MAASSWNKGKPAWNRGLKTSEEQKKKLSEAHKGKKLSEEHIRNISIALKGKPKPKGFSEKLSLFHSKKENRILLSNRMRGRNHPAYIDGRSIYRGEDWRWQRRLCLERDNFTCQSCGKEKYIQVHHIFPYEESKDNRLTNLISLCGSCHRKVELGTLSLLIRKLNAPRLRKIVEGKLNNERVE